MLTNHYTRAEELVAAERSVRKELAFGVFHWVLTSNRLEMPFDWANQLLETVDAVDVVETAEEKRARETVEAHERVEERDVCALCV